MAQEVRTEIELDAPVGKVWALLADIDSWDDWNSVFRFRRADARQGGRGLLLAKVGPVAVPLPIQFDVVDKERELRWHGGLPHVVHGSHYLKLEALENNRTRLVHGEDFSGIVISASWRLIGKQLPAAYRAFNRALERRLG